MLRLKLNLSIIFISAIFLVSVSYALKLNQMKQSEQTTGTQNLVYKITVTKVDGSERKDYSVNFLNLDEPNLTRLEISYVSGTNSNLFEIFPSFALYKYYHRLFNIECESIKFIPALIPNSVEFFGSLEKDANERRYFYIPFVKDAQFEITRWNKIKSRCNEIMNNLFTCLNELKDNQVKWNLEGNIESWKSLLTAQIKEETENLNSIKAVVNASIEARQNFISLLSYKIREMEQIKANLPNLKTSQKDFKEFCYKRRSLLNEMINSNNPIKDEDSSLNNNLYRERLQYVYKLIVRNMKNN
jgi:hypothetical protein